MAENTLVQTIRDAEIDARSLSEFIFKPADFMVIRRLAPPIHTIEYYTSILDGIVGRAENIESQIITIVNDAIDTAAIPSAPITDAMVNAGGITQRTVNMGFECISDMIATSSPQDGKRYFVKSYHRALGCGGGEFEYKASLPKSNHDGGFIISPTVPFEESMQDYINKVGETDASGNGCFVRIKYDSTCDVFEYGARTESMKASASSSAAINAALKRFGTVFVRGGRFNLHTGIRIPSNRTLILSSDTELYLRDGANDYILSNDDLDYGNKNITLIGNGAKLNGNRLGQTRKLGAGTGRDRSVYFGFGCWFVDIENFVMRDFRIEFTNAWGIGYWGLNFAHFDRLIFEQTDTVSGFNADGLTGSGSNLLIENISGFTSDDMICVTAGGGTVGGKFMEMPQTDIENIVVRNVTGTLSKSGGKPSFRGVRLTGKNGCTMRNVSIDGVKGYLLYNAVEAANFWIKESDDIYALRFEGLRISNCSRTAHPLSSNTATVNLFQAYFRDVVLDDIRVDDNSGVVKSTAGIQVSESAKIDSLVLNNCHYVQRTNDTNGGALLRVRSNIDYLKINNCTAIYKPADGVYPVGTKVIEVALLAFYQKDFTNAATLCRAVISNCTSSSSQPVENTFDINFVGTNSMLSVRTDYARIANLEKLNPQEGDTVYVNGSNKKHYYQNGQWVTPTMVAAT